MPARTQKKFRIEIQQEQHLAKLNGKAAPLPDVKNGAGYLEILEAIQALRDELVDGVSGASGISADTERIIQEKLLVENELKMLSKSLDDTKREIAGLRYSSIYGDRLISMNHQLDEVVAAAEEATNNILASAEVIDADVQKMQANASEEDEITALEAIGEQVIKIYEACNFQDLTGQRVTKVIETLKHVEARVDAMIKCLGGDEEAIALLVEPEEEEVEEVALHGPQSEGQGISQADIDSMFD